MGRGEDKEIDILVKARVGVTDCSCSLNNSFLHTYQHGILLAIAPRKLYCLTLETFEQKEMWITALRSCVARQSKSTDGAEVGTSLRRGRDLKGASG